MHRIMKVEQGMKTSKNFRSSALVFLVLIMLIASTFSFPISIVYPVKAGKYGNIVPTLAELQLLDKINENRTDNGATPLKLNATLWWVARAHGQDMIDFDFFDHDSSQEGQFNGATFQERVNNYAGYKNNYIGETIALKGSGINVEWCMSAWKNSPSHWEIIIDPNLQEIGIGLLEGEWSGSPNAGLHTADFGGGSISVDLAVSDLDIEFDPPWPYHGQEVNVSATVHNLGLTDAFPVKVKFFDGDPDSGGVQIGAKQQVPHILVHGESATLNLIWDTTGKAGGHNVYVVVDADNIVAETNEGNNKAFKSLVVNITNAPIHLYNGWNLASFPYTISDTSLENVLSSIYGKYDSVQYYNSSTTQDFWKHHHVSKPAYMNDLRDLDNKMGFWIHIIDADGADLMVDGESPSSPQHVSLRQGWNLVGYPSTAKRLRNEALNNLVFGDEIDAVEYQDNATKAIKTLEEGEYMEPGKGYWLHATQNCVWIVIN